MTKSDRSGFVLSFERQGLDGLARHDLGLARWTETETDEGRAWCFGELLSYGSDGDTATCLKRLLADWKKGAVAHSSLNGRFILIFRNTQSGELQIVTDRLGSMHAYMVKSGERSLGVGSDLSTLVRQFSTRQLDWEGIASLFSFGFFLGDRTHFAYTRILLPHSVYRISPYGEILERRSYWNWHHMVDEARSFDETVDAYDRLLRQAMQRCTAGGRVALPISGGLDSRSLAAVLPDSAETTAYSYGYSPDSVELAIAARIAQKRGLSYSSHVIRPYLFERLAEITRALHGCQDVTAARQVSVNDWVREHADAVLTGLWGDVWCDQIGLADGLPAGTTLTAHALHKFQKAGRAWLLENVVAPHVSQDQASQLLTDSVTAGLSGYSSITDLDFRMKAYKTSSWCFRWSNASLRGFEIGAAPRAPYFDSDLVDFFCTVPTAFLRGRRLQVEHLKRYAPDLARIRWQKAEANLYLARYGYWLSLPRRAVSRTVRTVTHRRPLQRNWEVQFLCQEGREGLQTWLLEPGLKLHDFVAVNKAQKLIDRLYAAPNEADAYAVSMLLTFSAWLKVGL